MIDLHTLGNVQRLLSNLQGRSLQHRINGTYFVRAFIATNTAAIASHVIDELLKDRARMHRLEATLANVLASVPADHPQAAKALELLKDT
jgi:hypothetical protein